MSDDDYDLRFVDPHRRDEVARRIGIIRSFLAAPGRRNAEKAAAELGMSFVSFYELVRAWRSHGDPARLPGSGNRRTRNLLSDDQMSILRRANESSPDGPMARVTEIARAEAKRSKVPLPSDITLRQYIKGLRRGRSTLIAETGANLVVDHCEIEVPVSSEGAVVRPLLTAVIDIAHPRVVGLSLSIGDPDVPSTSKALLDAHERGQLLRTGGARLILDRSTADDWSALADALTDAGMDVIGDVLEEKAFLAGAGPGRLRRNGRAIVALVGTRVASFRVFVRTARRGPVQAPHVRRGATPLTLGEAEEMLAARLELPSVVAVRSKAGRQLEARLAASTDPT